MSFRLLSNSTSDEYCSVFDTDDSFTSYVQFLLAVMALASLWFKRQRETPRRDIITWSLDVGKMGGGAVYAHIANMLVAKLVSTNVRGSNALNDECAWYAMNFLIDTSFGLLFSILFLGMVEKYSRKYNWVTLKDNGVYLGPNKFKTWRNQCLVWIGILTAVKIILTSFLWFFSGFFAVVGDVLFKPMQGSKKFELVFVMVFFPGVLNVMYFWIADSYLKQSHPEGSEPMALDDESGGDYHLSNEGEGRGRTGSDPMMMNSSAGNLGLLTEEVVLGKGKTKKKGKGAFEMTSIVPEEPVWLKQAEKDSADRYHGIDDMAL
ncbi:hypothetical protein TrST_g8563 [Triparma strigata]|uniref:Uncharacterized protein n=1 Tax=Triparma strigata TaxID=1606541 RepID=A0A9W7EH48_9STRA|nr:hypothetical protein TrST_g8563 [Triparma strigata]